VSSVLVGVAPGREDWCEAGLIYVLTDMPASHGGVVKWRKVVFRNIILDRLLDIEPTRIVTGRYRQMGVFRYYNLTSFFDAEARLIGPASIV
jgi:hypothetical protein